MRHATEEESEVIWQMVEAWFKDAPAGSMFSSAKSTAKMAVAEYIANQQNVTLYRNCAS